jgi:hypothetical protein
MPSIIDLRCALEQHPDTESESIYGRVRRVSSAVLECYFRPNLDINSDCKLRSILYCLQSGFDSGTNKRLDCDY